MVEDHLNVIRSTHTEQQLAFLIKGPSHERVEGKKHSWLTGKVHLHLADIVEDRPPRGRPEKQLLPIPMLMPSVHRLKF
jgi:hypothetical protein